jgi:hypothetical protein
MRALMLLLLLTGCGTTTELLQETTIVEVVKYETVPVPAVLLEPCKLPELDLKTNKDLESALAAAITELQRCTEDKVAISELE